MPGEQSSDQAANGNTDQSSSSSSSSSPRYPQRTRKAVIRFSQSSSYSSSASVSLKDASQDKKGVDREGRLIGDTLKGVLETLKKHREGKHFKARPYLTLDADGVVHIDTGKMPARSQREVWNYACRTNRYIRNQKGQKAKIKSTKKYKHDQQLFCDAVKTVNKDLFATLNKNYKWGDLNFSVVGHVPDLCLFTTTSEGSFAQTTPSSADGMRTTPGWMPMTSQANNLVSKIGLQTSNTTGQQGAVYVKKIKVNGQDPDGTLPIAGMDDHPMGEDVADENGSSSSSSNNSSSSSNDSSSSSNNSSSSSNNSPSARTLRHEARSKAAAKNASSSSSSSPD